MKINKVYDNFNNFISYVSANDVLTLRYIVTKTYTKNIEQLLLTY